MLQKHYVWWAILISAIAIPYLVIVDNAFPFFGLGFSFMLLATLLFAIKPVRSKTNLAFYTVIMLLSLCLLIWSSTVTTVLNIIAVLVLGAFFAKPEFGKAVFSFMVFALSPISTVLHSVLTKNLYTSDSAFNGAPAVRRFSVWLKALAITLLVLIVVLPLLAAANPIFDKFVAETLKLQQLFDWLFPKDAWLVFIRLIFFTGLMFFIPKLLSYTTGERREEKYFSLTTENGVLILPKLVTSIVIAIFFVTQLQLYFSSEGTLQAMGYTHSQYAREVFAELTIVSMIIGALLYNDKNRSKKAVTLTYVLLIESVFLAVMAFKSDFDYSSKWGFTQARLWGFTGVFWIVSMLGFFTYLYAKRIQDYVFVRGVLLFSAMTLILVNVFNFDYLIYHFRKSSTESGVDYHYLSKLSSDAQAYDDMVKKPELQPRPTGSGYEEYPHPHQNLGFAIDYLQKKYSHFDLRGFNLSEYLQYVSVKSVDPKPLEDIPAPSTINPDQSFSSPTPSTQAKEEALPNGTSRIIADEGYVVTTLPGWKLAPDSYAAFRLIKGNPEKVDVLLQFMRLDDSTNFNEHHLPVKDWLAIKYPPYWYDAVNKRSVPFTEVEFPTRSGNGIMRDIEARNPNKTIYLPDGDRVLVVGYGVAYDRMSPAQVNDLSTEVKQLLSSYTVSK